MGGGDDAEDKIVDAFVRTQLRRRFRLFDLDFDGKISKNDLKNALI